jgi:putative membrane protein
MILIAAQIACFIVIALHLYFAVLEMALWKNKGPKIFGITPQFAAESAALASNQGLYNLFLAAALLIGMLAPEAIGKAFILYGLGCVIVAGLWGAKTVSKRIFFVQALPALIALGLFLIGQ